VDILRPFGVGRGGEEMRGDIYDRRARIAKALAHPLRLKIIDQLASDRERCVCELVEAIGCDQPVISKHLAVLRNAGVVAFRQEGTSVYYRLRTPCIKNFLECIDRVIKEDLQEIKKEMDGVFSCIDLG
jgi:ArsR family transcriptional regulator